MQNELDPTTSLPTTDNPFKNALELTQRQQPISLGAPTSSAKINLDEWKGIIRRVGADNEETRAQAQTGWDLTKGALAQTAATIIGGTIEGAGYMLNLADWGKMSSLFKGEDADFSNILTDFGKGIQDYTADKVPIYQTRAAQEGWALGDGSWWASHFPSLASTLSIMLPVVGASAALRLGARSLNKVIRTTATGTKALDAIGDARLIQQLNNSTAMKIANQGSLSLTSRHIENSMESSGVFEQIYNEKIAEGMDEERARAIAGESAAQVYRIGYWNLWQDVIAWNVLLKGNYANRTIAAGGTVRNPKVQKAIQDLRQQYGDSGIIPAAALTKAGVSKKDLLVNAFSEGFEEFNQEFQQNYGLDYADFLSGKVDRESPKGYLESYFSRDLIDSATDRKTWDATFWGFLGGLVFGSAAKYGVFDRSVDFMTRKNQMDNVNYLQREGAKFEYIKNLGESIIKYHAEGDYAARDATIDRFSVAMTLGQIVDGNTGIAVQGSIPDGRFQEVYNNFKKIAEIPESQLDTQEKKDAKEVATLLLPKMQNIKEVFEKNYKNTQYNKDYDLAIVSALTEYQFLSEEYGRRISNYKSQLAEIKNNITTSPDATTLGEKELTLKAFQRAKEKFTKDLQEATKFTESLNIDDLSRSDILELKMLKETIDKLDEKISNTKTEIEEFKKESQEKDLDLFSNAYVVANEQAAEIETIIEGLEYFSDVYKNKYAQLQTNEGKEAYIKAIKKADKNRQKRAEEAAIANAKTEEEVNALKEIVETPDSKLKITEKEKEIINERLAEVRDLETTEEVENRLKEIENEAQLGQETIDNLKSGNQNLVDAVKEGYTPETAKLIDEYVELLPSVQSDVLQAQIAKEIDEGETTEKELKVPEEAKPTTKELPTESTKLRSTQESNSDSNRKYALNFTIDTETKEIDISPSKVQQDNPRLEVGFAASPSVQSGDIVYFELPTIYEKDSLDKEKGTTYNNITPENRVIYIVHKDSKKVIATVPSSKDNPNLLNLRKSLIELLEKGEEVETTISSSDESQIIATSNVNDVFINGKYYNVPLKGLEQVLNHKGEIGFPITLAFVEGNEFSEVKPELSIPQNTLNYLAEYYKEDYKKENPDATEDQIEDFASTMIGKMQNDIKDTRLSITKEGADLTLSGLPYVVLPAPNGKFKALRLENSKLVKTHIDFIIKQLQSTENTENSAQVINRIVYTNSDVENHFKDFKSVAKRTEDVHKTKRQRHFRVRAVENNIIIEFYSQKLEQIISTRGEDLATNQYKIIKDAKTKEDGKIETVYSKGEEALNLIKELELALSQKFFNIQKGKLYDPQIEGYKSDVTGVDYESYFDYLTSPEELTTLEGNTFAEENLTKSILSTNIKPVDGSPFHNVAIIYDPITYTDRTVVIDKVTEININDKATKETKTEPTPKVITTRTEMSTIEKGKERESRRKQAENRKQSIKKAEETQQKCKG
jgi:hypothetical protein